MNLTLDNNSAHYQIKAFKPGLIKINQNEYHHSLIVGPSTLIENWPPQQLSELTYEHLLIASECKPDIILLGTGEHLQFPDLAIYGDLMSKGIGIEIMDTHAACRTYNVLTAEERNVVAALIIR